MRDINTRIGVEDRASRKLQQAGRHVKTYGRTWRTAARVASRAMIGMDRGFRMLHRGMGRLMRRAKFMMIGFQITAIIMGVQMVSAALKYERALRNVTSLMAGAGMQALEVEKNFRVMDQAIRGIATRTGQMPLDLAEGMYNVVSATFDGASGLKVLEASALGAFAGLSTTEVVTGLLTKTLQAYRKEGESNNEVADKSMEIMDMFFMSVNRGMFTFDDLAAKFGSVTSTGAAFGIELQDLLGFLSTATVRGVGMDEALTGMRQTILSIVSDSPAVAAAAEELFGADVAEMWGAQALAGKGLLGVLQGLNETLPEVPSNVIDAAIAMEEEGGDAAGYMAEQLGLSVQAITALFPNIRALKGVLAVTGAGMSLYGENVESITESSGAMNRAQGEMVKSAQGALQFLKAAWATFKIDAGGIVLPFLKEATDGIMQWWGRLPAEFAAAQGVNSSDLEAGLLGDIEGAALQRRVDDLWGDAAPGERVAFILQNAWRTGLTNLGNWFDNGGEGTLQALGEKLGNFMTGVMDAIAGTTAAGAKDSIGYKFGEAFITGFKNAWSEWIEGGGAKEFLGSTLGSVIAGAVAYAVTKNPLVAIGTGVVANQTGGDLDYGTVAKGAGLLYLLKKLFSAGGPVGPAATGAGPAATGAGSGGFFSTLFGKGAPRLTTVGQTGALTVGRRLTGVAPFQAGTEVQPGESMEHVWWRLQKEQSNFFDRWLDDLMGVVRTEPEYYRPGMAPDPNRMFDLNTTGPDWMPMVADDMDSAASTFSGSVDRFGRAVASISWGAGGMGTFPGPGDTRLPPPLVAGGGHQAHGSSGTVRRPTLFLAGEAGAEDYQFVPKYKGKAGGGGVTIQGPLIGNATISTDMDVREVTAQIVREFEKAVSNG